MKKLFFSFLFIFSFMTAWACDCEPKATPQEAYAAADIVFVGKVINAETNWISGGYKYIFQVERTWKMSADTLLYLKTPLEQDCGYIFEKGKRYLVYANKKFTAKETDSCSGSKTIEEATEDLQLWGEGTTPRDPKMLKMNMWTVGIAMVAGMVFLGVVVWRGGRRGRNRE
jgi:hypothetical protein